MTAIVLEDLELGDCADSRPLVGGIRLIQDIDESGWWVAQVDERPDRAGAWDQGDYSGHMVEKANRARELCVEVVACLR